ncbi:hypothetical protein U1Q18_037993 [Sarracenia purpurea var. burkii]
MANTNVTSLISSYMTTVKAIGYPLGPPAIMMSPQPVDSGMVKPDLVEKRDQKYNISTNDLKASRVEIPESEWINPVADYWKQHGKGFAIDVEPTEIKKRAPFP